MPRSPRLPEPPTLEQQRYRALVLQLHSKFSQEVVADKLDISQTMVSTIVRDAKQAGLASITKARERLGIDPAFFTDPSLGPDPKWTDHVAQTHVEYDAEVKTTLIELVAAWSAIAIGRPEIGEPPSDEEREWLQRYSFREDRRMGIVVDAQLLLERLLTRRRQQRGRQAATREVQVDLRPGRTLVVDDAPKRKPRHE